MATPSQFGLLAQRRFAPFFLAQLAGAFNDNLLKQVLVLLVAYHGADYGTLPAGIVTSLAGGIFILPFVLFSALAGQCSDRYDKTRLIQVVKGAEVLIMGVAAWGFAQHSLALLLFALFLMGTHSTFFGPAKYAILPRVLDAGELVGGNALLETGTFVAILAGTLCAGLLVTATADPLWLAIALLVVAALGLAASCGMPPNGRAAPELAVRWNPVATTRGILAIARRDRTVWLSLLGISWFWFFGALFLSQLPVLVHDELGAGAARVTELLAVFAVGVAAGSLLCERLSAGRVEWGLVPFGSLGMSLAAADLWWSAGHPLRLMADILLLGAFGGLFNVPLYATVQQRSRSGEQSRVIAANNVLNALFMVLAAALGAALAALHARPSQIIGVAALLNAAVAAYLYTLLPEFLWRFVAWLLVHTVYRVRKEGLQHLPERGAAVLAPNHVSYVDALVLSAACPRPIRFVMDHTIFRSPMLGWLFRSLGAIPISPARESPEVLAQAHARIAAALEAGELVCIFPEGRLSADGRLGELRRGIVEVIARTPVPVIPVLLGGLDRSIFARATHRRAGLPTVARRIAVRMAHPLAPGSWTLESLRAALERLAQSEPTPAPVRP